MGGVSCERMVVRTRGRGERERGASVAVAHCCDFLPGVAVWHGEKEREAWRERGEREMSMDAHHGVYNDWLRTRPVYERRPTGAARCW